MAFKISEKKLETWADYILDYSLGGIKPQDVVMVKGEHITWPLMSVLQDKIFAAGALADINLVAPDNNRGQVWGASITRNGTTDQIHRVPEWYKSRYENMTKYIEILGAEDPEAFANLPEATARELSKADQAFKVIRLAKKWVLTLFPTNGFAKIEGMSLEDYSQVIIKAATTDPRLLEEVETPIARLMEKTETIKIVTSSPKTRENLVLTMNVLGRNVVKCTGLRNFPDGEVFTSPDAGSTEGEIFVDLPVLYNGVTIRGIYLKFKQGKIIGYSAEEGRQTLKGIIETDEGSHRLGEVALGMNSGIQRALKHPLFVEKVGGTLHIAIGASYPECYVDDPNSPEAKPELDLLNSKGIFNKSAQHVDIVVDFRPGGAGKALYFDNTELKIDNNIWVVA